MAQKTAASRDISKLAPSFKKKVEAFLSEVSEKLGNVIFISEAWRSKERQAELLKSGLSKVKHSNHQDGLAIDIAFFGSELYPSDIKKWRAVADIAKEHGISWGYDLWQWDKPHFQDNGQPIIEVNNSKEQRNEAKRLGLWNGERENEKCTRGEVGKISERLRALEAPTLSGEIWNKQRQDDTCTRFEAVTMLERSVGKKLPFVLQRPDDKITRGEVAELAVRL